MPPRIDFYILSEQSPQARERFACKLTEKAYRAGHRVFLLSPDADRLQALDQLLWTFRPGSFLPHGAPGEADEPIQLGTEAPAQVDEETLLINLGDQMPAGWERFGRLAEVIDQSPPVVSAGRQRFRQYRDSGCQPASHKL